MRKKIFVRAPCLSQSGYGEQSRFALRALRSREDIFDIYVQPIPWGNTGWVWENTDFRRWVDEKIIKTQLLLQEKTLHPDISLQITIPNEFENLAPENIGYTAGIETTKVAPEWLQKGNEQVDKILVVSNHSRDTYKNTVAMARKSNSSEEFEYRLETPVEVVWENTPRAEPEVIPGLDLELDFNFLVVSQMGPRKNLENTIKWFIEEFIDQEVGLIVKTNTHSNSTIDLQHTDSALKKIVDKYPNKKCKVYLLHGDLTSGQMTSLYTNPNIKAMINISHGEGFGLPLFEAAREGMPIIAVGWSGQLDFLSHEGQDYFTKVNHTLEDIPDSSVWDGVLVKGSQWAYAEQGSYKMSLRNVYKNWDDAKKTSDSLAVLVNEKFSNEVLYGIFCDSIYKPDPQYVEWLKELEELNEE